MTARSRGPTFGQLAAVFAATSVPVVASGGVGSLDDLRALARLRSSDRAPGRRIVGRAIYEGRFGVATPSRRRRSAAVTSDSVGRYCRAGPRPTRSERERTYGNGSDVIDEGFLRRYRELLDAEDAAFDELEHAYEEGDRAH